MGRLTTLPPLRRRPGSLIAGAAVAVLLLSGCLPVEEATDGATPDAPPAASAEARADSAQAVLSTLPVKGRAPMTGYQRERFGQAWLDADRNGCDTRNDMLARDLVDVVFAPGAGECKVSLGALADPYTARQIRFRYGDGTLVDIDHVVALGNVWATGGFGWPVERRAAIANDPLNLLSVDASANRQKGDGDAATWLPPNKRYRCSYVARQVAVKAKYGLWVTPAERDAIARVLETCPEQALPADSGAPVEVDQNITDPGAERAPESAPKSAPGSADGTGDESPAYYENCDAARAAGAAPVRRGDPGYGAHLDRDGDGRACE